MARGIIRRKSKETVAQPKLKVGQPGDKYEQEADAMADQVVANHAPAPEVQMSPLDEEAVAMQPDEETVRMNSDEEQVAMSPEDEDQISMKEDEEVALKEDDDQVSLKEDEEVAMKPDEELSMMGDEEKVATKEEDEVSMKEDEINRKPAIQKSGDGTYYAAPAIAQQIHETKGQGSYLGKSTQQEFGQKMGADFSKVKIHTGQNAETLNDSLGAKAFAHGQDIYFNRGNYDPGSSKGKHLLAHELTHTIQQSGNSPDIQADFLTDPINDNPDYVNLTKDEIQEAIDFNNRRIREIEEIQVLRDVLGLSEEPAVIDGELIDAILSWQARNDIDQDGKIGPVTASRISKEYWAEARSLGRQEGRELRRMARRMDNRSFTISVTAAARSHNTRGSAVFGVQWDVPDRMANGWIIQHVRFEGEIEDAAGNAVASNNAGLEYWEGWQVVNGEVFIGRQADGNGNHNQDTFQTISENAGTRGQVRIMGTVRFMPDYNLTVPPWGFAVPAAGALPTMVADPPGWVEGGARRHNMIVDFDNTLAAPIQNVTTRP